MSGYKKPIKYSYSRLNVYNSCAWRYKLQYLDGHFINIESLAADLGTTLHYIEENIARSLKDHEEIDYDQLKDEFQNINIPKTSPYDTKGGIYGVNILKEKYKEEFYKPDDNGVSYNSKVEDYMNFGIYRLEKYIKDNPGLEVYDMEKFFSVNYNGHVLSGFIDRIFYNRNTDKYIIEDIKTKGKPFKDEELKNPLQFLVYMYALHEGFGIPYEDIECYYDLPFCQLKEKAIMTNFLDKNGDIKKITHIFGGIDRDIYEPNPTPLCHWCNFCPTNPNQPEEGKNLCPYYSLWTRENKTYAVSHRWRGMENHESIMAHELKKQAKANENDNNPEL